MWYLAVLGIRALGLALLAGLALRACRVRSASAKHAVWTVITAVMLLQGVASPAPPALPLRVLAPAPDAGPSLTPQLALPPLPVPAHNRDFAFTCEKGILRLLAAVASALLV